MYKNDAARMMLKKSAQKFSVAELSFQQGFYDSCVSELYYSAFQAVTALIILRGEQVSNKHTYVRGWVGKNLGQTGLIPIELVKVYNRLMDHRMDADYSVEISFGAEEVGVLIEQVRAFYQALVDIMMKEMN